ncbi:MAG: CBS domain-containing protein [Candidatus Bathyarchaeota archaeon]|nr:CBS domain-containing protein [Candidatus Bathyarchaeota archaeon]
MAGLEIRSKLLVKDVMTSPVITVMEDSRADEAAKLMRDNNIGCVIVSNKDGKPIGIITERDLVIRVVAEDIQPSKVTAKEIMSTPLITIDADKTISEAAREMNRHDIRRLAVMYKGQLVGIISSKDILSVTPELIEIIQERAKISAGEEVVESLPLAGYCDNCGAWSDNLREADGTYLCEDCYSERMRSEY